MTALTTAAIQGLFGLLGSGRSARPLPAPWMRHRISEADLERLRLADRTSYRF